MTQVTDPVEIEFDQAVNYIDDPVFFKDDSGAWHRIGYIGKHVSDPACCLIGFTDGEDPQTHNVSNVKLYVEREVYERVQAEGGAMSSLAETLKGLFESIINPAPTVFHEMLRSKVLSCEESDIDEFVAAIEKIGCNTPEKHAKLHLALTVATSEALLKSLMMMIRGGESGIGSAARAAASLDEARQGAIQYVTTVREQIGAELFDRTFPEVNEHLEVDEILTTHLNEMAKRHPKRTDEQTVDNFETADNDVPADRTLH